ncbi:hypothetical protein QWZ13_17850 [Reinekea marina]|uniref:hypothetical protein n=1 Tax=Reinekea marina TaxID=1310421 RepID=UPI0025B578EE|nr:hypothetical protein [Reinekea marina]MDN3650774.1 hypothetical protein [Reinekea marina]
MKSNLIKKYTDILFSSMYTPRRRGDPTCSAAIYWLLFDNVINGFPLFRGMGRS